MIETKLKINGFNPALDFGDNTGFKGQVLDHGYSDGLSVRVQFAMYASSNVSYESVLTHTHRGETLDKVFSAAQSCQKECAMAAIDKLIELDPEMVLKRLEAAGHLPEWNGRQ